MGLRGEVTGRRWVALLLVTMLATGLGAGQAMADKPDDPGAQGQGHGAGGSTASPTPSPSQTPSPTASATPSATASAAPSATASASPSASATAGPASAPSGATHPPGNNGTVKIDGRPWDNHPDNEPHVGCTFQLDFYGYDEGSLDADYLFELWSPTGSGDLVSGTEFIGEDEAGGGTDHDASVTVDIESELLGSGVDPHPIQGWHIRLTVHAEGSIGADVKHKMFWVTCGGAAPTQSPTGSPSVGPTQTRPPSPTLPPTVQPSTIRPPTAPPGNLPFTGSALGQLLAVALGLLLAGTAALRASTRLAPAGKHSPQR